MTTKTNTKRDQEARELVRVIREDFRGQHEHLRGFCSMYLTTSGKQIAKDARPTMRDDELLAIAYRAVDAGN